MTTPDTHALAVARELLSRACHSLPEPCAKSAGNHGPELPLQDILAQVKQQLDGMHHREQRRLDRRADRRRRIEQSLASNASA